MVQRRPLCRIGGATKELPVGDKVAGTWAKAVAVPAGGVVAATIPAGIFAALPVISHSIQAAGARDYILRISALTLNADKTITLAGVVRQSQVVALGGDTFTAATTAVTVHLVAMESD